MAIKKTQIEVLFLSIY